MIQIIRPVSTSYSRNIQCRQVLSRNRPIDIISCGSIKQFMKRLNNATLTEFYVAHRISSNCFLMWTLGVCNNLK